MFSYWGLRDLNDSGIVTQRVMESWFSYVSQPLATVTMPIHLSHHGNFLQSHGGSDIDVDSIESSVANTNRSGWWSCLYAIAKWLKYVCGLCLQSDAQPLKLEQNVDVKEEDLLEKKHPGLRLQNPSTEVHSIMMEETKVLDILI